MGDLCCIQQTPADILSNHVSHLETQIDFKWKSCLEIKTSSGNLIDSRTLFLRISITNTQERDPKGLGPMPEC